MSEQHGSLKLRELSSCVKYTLPRFFSCPGCFMGSSQLMPFQSEKDLVDMFAATTRSRRTAIPRMSLGFEFSFGSGRTDVIGVTASGTVHAFEAKLKHWRHCLDQAYRNTSFSHYSYVVLPLSMVEHALKKEELFTRRGVGLCSVDSGRIRLHIKPARKKPVQPWLTQMAIQMAKENH